MVQNMHRQVIICYSGKWPFLLRLPLPAFLWIYSLWFLVLLFFSGGRVGEGAGNRELPLISSYPLPALIASSLVFELGEKQQQKREQGLELQQLFPSHQHCTAPCRAGRDIWRPVSHHWRRKSNIWGGNIRAKKDQAITQSHPLVPDRRAGLRAPVGVVVKLAVKFISSLSCEYQRSHRLTRKDVRTAA